MADATDFKLNTDYPFDKVIYLTSGSFTIANNTIEHIVTIPHGLSFAPLTGGNWSLNSDFSIQYEYATGTFPSTALGYINDQIVNIYADTTNVYISADNVNSSSKLIYYRVFGFQPSTDSSHISPIASLGDRYLLNTDYTNMKILLDSYEDLPATVGSVNVAVAHNLGYIPQAIGWVTYASWNGSAVVQAVHPIGSSSGYSQGVLLSANSSHINFTLPAGIDAHRAYYKVYYDV